MNDNSISGFIAILVILVLVLFIFLLRLRKKVKDRDKERNQLLFQLEEAKGQLENFRLESLKFQLNPHTIINSISHLTNFASKTVEGLNGLNTIMSFMLHEGTEKLIPLKEEWKFLNAYININRLKLSPLVKSQIDCEIQENDPLFTRSLIPPFLTAYFVENAFKHGDTSQNGEFYINIKKQGNKLIYSVRNRISSLNSNFEKSNGIGKKNLSERLQIIYPDCHRISYNNDNGYYVSTIEIELN